MTYEAPILGLFGSATSVVLGNSTGDKDNIVDDELHPFDLAIGLDE